MAMSYHDQLNSALKYDVLSLSLVAADWKAALVEPLAVHSRTYGLRDFLPSVDKDYTSTALPVSAVADICSVVRKCSSVDVIRHSEFLQAVPRKVVVIYGQTYNSVQPREFNVDKSFHDILRVSLQSQSAPIIDCSTLFWTHKSNGLIYQLESALNAYRNPKMLPGRNVSIDKVLCFDHQQQLYTHEFLPYLPNDFLTSTEDYLVLFLNWRGCFIFDCSQQNYAKWTSRLSGLYSSSAAEQNASHDEMPTTRANFDRFKVVTKHSLRDFNKCTQSPFPHSKLVISTARTYLYGVIRIKRPFISVHIRTERLAKGRNSGKVHTDFLQCTLRQLAKVVAAIKYRNPGVDMLICTDFDERFQYGTDSCAPGFCQDSAKYLQDRVKNEFGWKVTKFDPVVLNSPNNAAFVGLVEMNMLSLGDYLVLVGHGNFQEQLLGLYLSQGKEQSTVFRVAEDNTCTEH